MPVANMLLRRKNLILEGWNLTLQLKAVIPVMQPHQMDLPEVSNQK